MEEKISIAVSGGRGLVGSRIVELLSSKYNFNLLGRSDGFDVTNRESFTNFDSLNCDYFLHLAAKADVDGCEAEKEMGEENDAWKINVGGTKNVSDYCKEKNIKVIYVSTDFVFDGEKELGDGYSEDDTPNPVNYYALTKYEGEKIVASSGDDNLIVRIAYPYRQEFEEKKDFVRAIMARLEKKESINAVTDHIMCPTYIDDVAFAIDTLIQKKSKGVFHVVGSTPISPFDAAVKIAEKFNYDKNLVHPTTRKEYFLGKALRPFNLYLKNDRIKNLGVEPKTLDEGLSNLNK